MKIINGGIFPNLCQHLDNSKNMKNNGSFNLLLLKREGKLGAKYAPFSFSLVATPEVFSFLTW